MIDFGKKTIAFVVPTGVGASIGGFAGDASCYARKFAEEFNVIVNPNVVNAACFSGITENMLYTEGWAMSEFFKGKLNLKPVNNNKIGVIFDKAISRNVLNVHINTINAVKMVYGVDVCEIEITDEPVGVEFFMTDSGISSGQLNNPETLLRSGRKLLSKGVDAIAVAALFDNPDESDGYSQGEAVDVVGGIEAVISHYLSSELMVPVAHAPAFYDNEISCDIVDARASAEYITPTFLPCILLGLQNAPKLVKPDYGGVGVKDLAALVMPYNSLGSSIVFDALKNDVAVFAVKENKTVLDIDKFAINYQNRIREFKDYDECLKAIRNMQPRL